MRLFRCTNCLGTVYFDNLVCLQCNHELGYLTESIEMVAFVAQESEPWQARYRHQPATAVAQYRPCANRQAAFCNWMVEPHRVGGLCRACVLTSVYPDQSILENQLAWQALENAKRQWLYTTLLMGLPAEPKTDETPYGLTFRMLQSIEGRVSVLTGHADGIITINVAESDPVHRLELREAMDEPYRTLLGHFRHESGHYYWQRLIADHPVRLESFRAMFGDETVDYGEALTRHYEQGPPVDWRENFVSGYAASHAWEDFAETWAHFMHIVDAVDVADAWGVSIENYPEREIRRFADQAHGNERFRDLMSRWLPLSLLTNSLNRSLGHEDAYPFAPSATVIQKLGWIAELVDARHGDEPGNQPTP